MLVSLVTIKKNKNTFMNFMRYYLISLFLFAISSLSAQQLIRGKVTSASSGLALRGITIKHLESGVASSTDQAGNFNLQIPSTIGTLSVSSIGYKSQTLSAAQINPGKPVEIRLSEDSKDLGEVVIYAPKRKYRNKNNPTVDFIRKVIERRDENNALKSADQVFSEYEKLSMSLGILNEKTADSRLLKKFNFLKAGLDTVKLPGRSLIPIYMNEKLGARTISTTQSSSYKLIGENQSRVDQFIDEDGIDEYLNKIYGLSDVYENDVAIGNRRFLSPVATLGPSFYKYYRMDTIRDTSPMQLKIRFVPRNPQDALFSGYLYVDLDGSYALRKAELTLSEATNINWVKSLQMDFDYDKNKDNKYFLNRSVTKIDLGLFQKGMNLFGEKVVSRTVGEPAKVDLASSGNSQLTTGKNDTKVNWDLMRPEKLSTLESNAFRNIDSLKNSKSFRNLMSVGAIVTSGYIGKGLLEIGPIPSFYSFNPVEGSRFKFGVNTTDQFSRRLVLEGYGAYGSKDQKFKYNLGAIYSLNGESVYKYPVSSISVRTTRDVRVPGQELNFLDNDNFLLSFRRGRNDRMIYYHKTQVELHHEFDNHISFKLGFKKETINPGGLLLFPSNDAGIRLDKISTTALTGIFRWAPGEKIYQGKRFRRIINTGMPIFSLSGEVGIKGLMGGDYDYQRFIFTANKRIFMSQLGFSDVLFESGIQFGKVPYPLMMMHRANQTYAYQANSFNLMNTMEFMSDRHSSLQFQHGFNGFILNKVPLLKQLDLREWLSFKVLYGHVNAENRLNNGGFGVFNSGAGGAMPVLFGLNRGPYVEGSVGLGNIFKILRIDVVRRFTYLDNPMVSKWGIRAKIGIDF